MKLGESTFQMCARIAICVVAHLICVLVLRYADSRSRYACSCFDMRVRTPGMRAHALTCGFPLPICGFMLPYVASNIHLRRGSIEMRIHGTICTVTDMRRGGLRRIHAQCPPIFLLRSSKIPASV